MTRKSSRQRLLSEPLFPTGGSPEELESALDKCLYWYRENFKPSQAKEWVAEYLKSRGDKDGSRVCHRGSKSTLRTLAPYCRLHSRGFPFSPAQQEQMDRWTGELLSEAREATPAPSKGAERPNIQERIQAKANALLTVLEPVIDDTVNTITLGKAKEDPLTRWVRNTEMTGPIAAVIRDRLLRTAVDLRAALDETDADLVEGYSYFKPKHLKQAVGVFESAVQIVRDRMGLLKQIRKPRKRKANPPEHQVRGLKFMPKSYEFGVASVPPASIIGAQGLIMFNTKKNRVTVFVAVEPKAGLHVKGSTVYGWDTGKSFEKTVRNPQEFLMNVGGCRKTFSAAVRYLNGVKTKTAEANGRINKHCLILQVQQ